MRSAEIGVRDRTSAELGVPVDAVRFRTIRVGPRLSTDRANRHPSRRRSGSLPPVPTGLTMLLLAVIALAVLFDYINGFHDTANAIATSVSTRALRPEHAILMSATANFVGALTGTAVAKTISSGLADTPGGAAGQTIVAAALIGAIIWNLITWRFGIPSSSSHALIGGLLGAVVVSIGPAAIKVDGVLTKVLLPLVLSPILGVVIGFLAMVLIFNVFQRANPRRLNARFRRLQVVSAAFMAFSHGSNDAQKTMGIMTLALIAGGILPADSPIPLWVIVLAATAMSLGTAAGGWRIINTMGRKVVKLDPVHGFAAETTAATIILTASHFGMPVSTTHVISSAIIGVGSSDRLSAVRWGVAGNIVIAWILTLPASALAAGVAYVVISPFL
jgi:PiT family inorganic phosphate transporter